MSQNEDRYSIGRKAEDVWYWTKVTGHIKYDGALQILIWVRNLVDLKLITQRQRLKRNNIKIV